MSQQTASSNKRLYYRLQGEINCLKKLIDKSAQGNFTVSYKDMVALLRETTEKLEETIAHAKQLGYVKPGSFKRQL